MFFTFIVFFFELKLKLYAVEDGNILIADTNVLLEQEDMLVKEIQQNELDRQSLEKSKASISKEEYKDQLNKLDLKLIDLLAWEKSLLIRFDELKARAKNI